MIDNQYNYSTPNKPVNMRLFFSKYLRNWYWFVIALVAALGGAYYYLRNTTPIYQVSAALLIKKEDKGMIGDDIIKSENSKPSEKNIENEIETLKSRTLIQRVVDDLNLNIAYFQKGDVRDDEEIFDSSPIHVNVIKLNPTAYYAPVSVHILNPKQYELLDEEGNKKGEYNFNQVAKSDYGTFNVTYIDSLYNPEKNVIKVAFYDKESTIQQYQGAVKVELNNQKSTVLKLGMETSVPSKGKAILAKLMDEYTFAVLTDKNKEAASTMQFIDERLRMITGELGNVEKNVESYKSEAGITDLSAEGNLFLESVKDNDARLNDVDIQLKMLSGVERYLRSSQDGAAPATVMGNDAVLSGLLRKLSDLSTQQEKYNRTTQPDNPYRQTIEAQIASTKASILDYVSNQRQNLLVTQSSLKQQNGRFTSSIRTIPRKEREFVNIKRQQSIKENLYLLLLQKKEETAIAHAPSITDSRVMDAPYSSPGPIKPSHSSIYMLAVFAGLLIPAGFISARGLMNDKVQSRKEIEEETGIAVFGEITRKPKQLKNNIVDLTSHSLIAEQFKILRANLQYAAREDGAVDGQVILITSSVSGEGKSFVSINLALSLALLNKKVIVLELDLRKPQTAQYLNMTQLDKPGISSYLDGRIGHEQLIQQTQVHPNLYFISSGPIPNNPTELLSNGRIQVLLDQLRNEFDYIILDTPPVSMLADATLLGPYTDTAFYVVRHEYTPRNYMRLLSNLNDSHKFKSLNVIVNAVNYPNSEDFGYGYSYPKRKAY
ncbi:GumC family protein [Spirosoma fluviale]|uniref:non-specific protein-tyrosine kinase n=1 Tax=Spirosoma fluviale TaxID=1597977 RepID=A0A286G7X4_9BACT|nr:polysaccharide biosynthesis tyrosine autokinase [Spirosoma fluviale]SOD91647.1 capsular exopolysaccharide family [Spirosoma fluviale]